MTRIQTKAQLLMERLVDAGLFLKVNSRRARDNSDKVGEITTKIISDENREILKTLKSEDIENVRWPR
jgi:hypothetical protein